MNENIRLIKSCSELSGATSGVEPLNGIGEMRASRSVQDLLASGVQLFLSFRARFESPV